MVTSTEILLLFVFGCVIMMAGALAIESKNIVKKKIVVGTILLVVGFGFLISSLFFTLSNHGLEKERNENVSDFLVQYYEVNDIEALDIIDLGDNKYKVELLNGMKDLLKVNYSKNNEVISIKIIDSSEDIK